MAATGKPYAKNYRSVTASAVPLAVNLADGEIALNTTDEKLFFKNTAGTVVGAGIGAVDPHIASTSNPHSVTQTQVGLANVDNTSDASKPVSTLQQAALDLKAPLASPALTGTPTAPTQTAGNNTTGVATTAFVTTAVANHDNLTDNPHAVTKTQVGLGNADNTSDANKPVSTAQQTALNLKANLASPALTGNPTAPTQIAGNNTTNLATTAFVASAVAGVTAGELGAVTSVSVDGGTGISTSGSPITSSGTITVTNTSPNATHTGEVTGSGALTIAANAVTNAKAAQMLVNTIKGRITTGTGNPEDLTAANVRTIINVADGATANTGTVTSVGVTAGTGISVSGSPVTTSGSITVTNSAPHVATNLSATAGTSAGPVINSSTGTNVTIPSASGTASGVVTTTTQSFEGEKTFIHPLVIANATVGTHAVNRQTGDDRYTPVAHNTAAAPHSGHALTSRTVTAGNGITGGGTLNANMTLTLGTPETLTSATTNAVTASSHTHAVTFTNDSHTHTAAQIGAATAGLALGAFGSYAYLCRSDTNANITAGSIYASSLLRYSGVRSTGGIDVGGTPAGGTWRAMGTSTIASSSDRTSTLFLRIS